MKTVHLPIYLNGIELQEHLEVSVELLQKLGASSTIYKGHVKVVLNITPAEVEITKQEIEAIDRIIHGFPPRPTVHFPEAGVFDVGVCISQGEPVPEVEWRVIPGFARYRMNNSKVIVEDFTDQKVSVTLGRLNNVLLSNDAGVMKRMSVNHLFGMTFPELSE